MDNVSGFFHVELSGLVVRASGTRLRVGFSLLCP